MTEKLAIGTAVVFAICTIVGYGGQFVLWLLG